MVAITAATATATLLSLLVKEVGKPMATKIWDTVSGKENADRLEQAANTAVKGVSALESLKRAFGDQYFLTILQKAQGVDGVSFTYEANRKEYIRFDISDDSLKTKIDVLRMEININLDRIVAGYKKNMPRIMNEFRGIYAEWKKHYIELFSLSDNDIKAFKEIEDILDENKYQNKRFISLIGRLSVGVVGFGFILRAWLLYSNKGLGWWGWVKRGFKGVPTEIVITLFLVGVVLISIALLLTINEKKIMNKCISKAYEMLEEKVALTQPRKTGP